MEDGPPKVITLDDLAAEMLSSELNTAIDQMSLEFVEVPTQEADQHEERYLPASEPLVVSKSPLERTNGHKKRTDQNN
jgi:hypothetical protein